VFLVHFNANWPSFQLKLTAQRAGISHSFGKQAD
jgi:hypothetical protein